MTFGIIEIFDNYEKPYVMRKDYKTLQKGEIWIRKGTRQSRANRTDLLELTNVGNKYGFKSKIKLGFSNDFFTTITLDKTQLKKDNLPSNIEREKLQELLDKLEKRYYSEEDLKQDMSQKSPTESANALKAIGNLFSDFSDKDKSIKVGVNYLGFPIYNNKETLQKRINSVNEDYRWEDEYYIFEENSVKLNFYILNDGTEFLDDVIIRFYFDKNVFSIAEEKPQEPRYSINQFMNVKTPIRNPLAGGYPNVTLNEETIIVTAVHENIRHKTPTIVFDEDLRLITYPNNDISNTIIKYEISAKNLPEPIKGELTVSFNSHV